MDPLLRPYKPAPEEKLVLHAVLLPEREVAEAYIAQEDVEDHPRLIVGLRLKRRSRRLRKRLQRTVAPVYARATA